METVKPASQLPNPNQSQHLQGPHFLPTVSRPLRGSVQSGAPGRAWCLIQKGQKEG